MKKSKVNLLALIFVFSLFSSTAFAISDNHVLSQNIKEADGTSGQDTNSGSGIKANHIQDGAITTEKIAEGAVTASKIGFYKNVIVVAPSGGDFTNPSDAINSIKGASASNRYLVKIMPGVYGGFTMWKSNGSYITIEGSGRQATKIEGGVGFWNSEQIELRDLTIENQATAISIIDTGRVRLTNIDVNLSNLGSSYNERGIWVQGGNAQIENVTISVDGPAGIGHAGVWVYGGSATLENVTINSTGYGIVGGDTINNSKIFGSLIAISGAGKVSNSQIGGSFSVTKCVNCFDADYNPIPNQ